MQEIGRYSETGTAHMTRLEALDAIEQSKRLLWSIERLLDKANKALAAKPDLRVVNNGMSDL